MTRIRVGDLVVIDVPEGKRQTRGDLHGRAGIVVGMTGCMDEKTGVYAKFDIRLNNKGTVVSVAKGIVLLKATPEQHPELFI